MKLSLNKRVFYKSRVHAGQGRITDIYEKNTGQWVKVHDKARDVVVTVRPSQISNQPIR